jgi:N-acetylneuraminate epimerase
MSRFQQIAIRSTFIALICHTFLSCHEMNKTTTNLEITWQRIPTDGLTGNLQKGVSASYAAICHDKLLVAGGCNFPNKLGFEGGVKVYYDDIVMMDTTILDKWTHVGKLPKPAAYGVSIRLSSNETLWIGGNTGNESLKNVYSVSLQRSGEPKLDSLPFLPATMDNFAGCAIENSVFVGGGNVNDKPSNDFYSLDIKNDSIWKKLPPFPGIPRVQPVMAGIKNAERNYVYLLGGFFGGDKFHLPKMAKDVYRYCVEDSTWEKVGEQIDPDTQKPFSLAGAVAMPLQNRYILCMGGVNYDIFLNAITTQYDINFNRLLTDEEKKQKNNAFSKIYMTQPIAYYKFNPECRIFDTKTNRWQTIDVTQNAARAGATLVFENDTFYLVQGELKPGVRTPITWKGEIRLNAN